jgi:hypothetical protein
VLHLQDQVRLLQHQVLLLQRDSALQLFRQAAGLSGPPGAALEEVEAAILEACGGLPLALKLMGGLLRGSQDRVEWQVMAGLVLSSSECVQLAA